MYLSVYFNSATNLKTLDVQGNAINSLGNHLFEGAENLTKIKMDSNQIEKVFINAFHGLTKLEKLSALISIRFEF